MSESTGPDPDETVDAPNPETGVGIGAGAPTTFEPEEDPETVPEDAEPEG